MLTTLDLVADLNAKFEDAHPREALEWAFESIPRFAIAASFQLEGLCMVDMARDMVERVPVLFLNTGFHFPETLEFRSKLVADWNLELIETEPTLGPAKQAEMIHPELYKADPDQCCELNKVLPMQRALNQLDGWATGLRRDQSITRRDTPIVDRQVLNSGHEVWKLAPMAAWKHDQVQAYADERRVPRHPLYAKGFRSIGCEPCTVPSSGGQGERDGRWAGREKTECGIHFMANSVVRGRP